MLKLRFQEMQSYEGELNHLAKLEEFLRVKGSRRICEADEKEEIKRQEEIQACEQDMAKHDALLEEIFVSKSFIARKTTSLVAGAIPGLSRRA